jgi:hypothetical protein
VILSHGWHQAHHRASSPPLPLKPGVVPSNPSLSPSQSPVAPPLPSRLLSPFSLSFASQQWPRALLAHVGAMVIPAPSRRHQELRLYAAFLFDKEIRAGALLESGTVVFPVSDLAYAVDVSDAVVPSPQPRQALLHVPSGQLILLECLASSSSLSDCLPVLIVMSPPQVPVASSLRCFVGLGTPSVRFPAASRISHHSPTSPLLPLHGHGQAESPQILVPKQRHGGLCSRKLSSVLVPLGRF